MKLKEIQVVTLAQILEINQYTCITKKKIHQERKKTITLPLQFAWVSLPQTESI